MIRHRLARMRSQQRDAGFTVLEALVSFVVFTIVATSASYGLANAIDASHVSQQRVNASGIAQQFVAEAIRQANDIAPVEGRTTFAGVGQKDSSGAQHAAEETFTVVETITYDNPGSCITGTLFYVHVVVRQAQTNQFLARSDARVACPRV